MEKGTYERSSRLRSQGLQVQTREKSLGVLGNLEFAGESEKPGMPSSWSRTSWSWWNISRDLSPLFLKSSIQAFGGGLGFGCLAVREKSFMKSRGEQRHNAI